MEAAPSLPRPAPLEYARRIDWSAVSTWLLGFGLIAYLGLKGGGFDPLVHDQVGIAIWWIVLAGVLVGALPRRRLGPLAWCALGLFAAFVAWTALSLTWTESAEKTSADLARVAGYLGVFALGVFARDSKGARRMVGAVAAGIAFVAIVALLSRLHPAWFPEAGQTARFLSGSQERLSYPINYWNALAALIAIGLPLMLHVATGARSALFRALAAAALPAMALTSFLTLSRGGIAAAIVALVIFLALTPDRLPKVLTLLIASAGGAILIAAATQRDAFQQGLLNATAGDQSNEMLAMTIVVCAGVGLLQAGISLPLIHGMRPRWTVPSRRLSLALATAAALTALVAGAALDAPGRASDAWGEFKGGGNPDSGSERLASVASENRYRLWVAAVRENETKPLTGTGAATFEYWWTREGDTSESVEDAHSLYMQTLGELGIVGLALLAAFLAAILLGGARNLLRADRRGRPQLAAALAGCMAFCIAVAFEWHWQIPVLPVTLLLLTAVLVCAGGRSGHDAERSNRDGPALGLPLRLSFSAIAIAAVVAIAIPLASTSLLRQSEAEVREGNPAAALRVARSAQNVQPSAATPRLQQALVLEELSDLTAAAEAARAAAEREPTNWRTWLVLSRIEAKRGEAAAALRDYRKASSLNPRSPLFTN